MKHFCWLLCLSIAVTQGSLHVARAQDYTFEFIQPPGTFGGGAYDMNNRGTALIYANNDTYLVNKNGRYTSLRDPYGNPLAGLGINSRSTVVGLAIDPVSGDTVGFASTRSGEFTALSIPPDQFPTGINDRDDIVGAGLGGSFVRYANGAIETFRYGADPSTFGYAINNRRQIAVQVWGLTRVESYIREPDGSFVHLEIPGATDLQVFGINNKGEVSGLVATNGVHGFIRYRDGSYSFIDVPGARVTYAWGINDSRQVSGSALFGDTNVAFIGTPKKHSRDEMPPLLRSRP